jgi:hypothetical protein
MPARSLPKLAKTVKTRSELRQNCRLVFIVSVYTRRNRERIKEAVQCDPRSYASLWPYGIYKCILASTSVFCQLEIA